VPWKEKIGNFETSGIFMQNARKKQIYTKYLYFLFDEG